MPLQALWAGIPLWAKLFGGINIAQFLGSLGMQAYGQSTQRKGLELQGSQALQAAAMGRKEEERYDELIEKLMSTQARKESRAALRQTQAEESQMAMALIAALSQFTGQEAAARMRSSPPTAMLSLMRSR